MPRRVTPLEPVNPTVQRFARRIDPTPGFALYTSRPASRLRWITLALVILGTALLV